MVIFGLMEYKGWGKNVAGFWNVKLVGILLGLGVIPVIYYTYTGILGVSADWFNITIFYIAAAVAYFTETQLFHSGRVFRIPQIVAMGVVFGLAAVYAIFSFYPPNVPLFRDPVDGSFGYFQA